MNRAEAMRHAKWLAGNWIHCTGASGAVLHCPTCGAADGGSTDVGCADCVRIERALGKLVNRLLEQGVHMMGPASLGAVGERRTG